MPLYAYNCQRVIIQLTLTNISNRDIQSSNHPLHQLFKYIYDYNQHLNFTWDAQLFLLSL